MNYDNRITGKIIKDLRKKKGLTQDVLSGLAGIARSHLAMIESGEKNANVDTLWRISDALGIKLSELLSMVEDAIKKEQPKPNNQIPSQENITEFRGQTSNGPDQDGVIPASEAEPDNQSYYEEII